MPGVPFSAGCCGGVQPKGQEVNDPKLEDPKQKPKREGNVIRSVPNGTTSKSSSGRKKVIYGAKEPCCCQTR